MGDRWANGMRKAMCCGLVLVVANLAWAAELAAAAASHGGSAAAATRSGASLGRRGPGMARSGLASVRGRSVPGPAVAPAPAATGTAAAAAGAAAAASTSGASALPPPQQAPGPATAASAGELAPLAPLSPQLQTQLSSGGQTASNLALSPGGTATSSANAPSTPGGGATLQDCMNFWERATHMSKAEWRVACTRTLHGLENATAGAAPALGKPAGAHAR